MPKVIGDEIARAVEEVSRLRRINSEQEATILDLRSEIARLSRGAEHDELTGLLNRAGIESKVRMWVLDGANCLTVCVIDIDNFKLINDTSGHEAGDQALVELGQVLNGIALAHQGLAARLSGDEFALLIPKEDEGIGDDLVDRCPDPALSVGIAVGSTERVRQLMQGADHSMYWSKHKEGTCYTTWHPDTVLPEPKVGERRSRDRKASPNTY